MSSISGGINFQGLGGTDFSAIIEQMKTVEEIPRQQQEALLEQWQQKDEALDAIIEGVKNLETALEELNSVGAIIQKDVKSSDDDVATATADADAKNGTTSINVEQLATNAVISFSETFYKNTVITEDKNPPVIEDFTFEYEGESHSIAVPTGTTIEGLVKLINEDQTNPGVTANLLKSGDKYIFQMQGDDTGSNASLTFDSASNPGIVGLDSTTAKTRESQDAIFTLNGFDDVKLTSTSNTIEGVVDGLEITVTDIGKTEITVSQSTEGIKEKIVEFMDATNELLKLFEEYTNQDAVINETSTNSASDDGIDNESITTGTETYNGQGGILSSEFAIQRMMSDFKGIISGSYVGSSYFDSETGFGEVYRSLSSIGIVTDSDKTSDTYGQLIFYEDPLLESSGEETPLETETAATLTFDKLFAQDEAVITGNAGDPPVPVSITYGSNKHTFEVPVGTTVEEFASIINAQQTTLGVTASAAKGDDDKYTLSITGKDKGEEYDIKFDSSQSNVALGTYTKEEAKDPVYSPFRTLDAILEEDPLAVANILAGNDIKSTSSYISYNSHIAGTTDVGSHEITYDVGTDGSINNVMVNGYKAAGGSDGNYTATEGPAKGLSFNIGASPPGSHSGSIDMQQGKISEMLDYLAMQTQDRDISELNDASGDSAITYEKGGLMVLKDSYETIMENLEEKIEDELERVERWETQQRSYYAQLDALLVSYEGQATSISSALQTMPAIS